MHIRILIASKSNDPHAMKNLAWLCAQVTKDGVDPWLTIDDTEAPRRADSSDSGAPPSVDAQPPRGAPGFADRQRA